ncbi:hypothetical protein LHGZ1_2211 [Laribacter hongkongensis]|uniref:Uncharacterized protein n=1 Tax=Laribacter hongkongensis TaxID=168471 RepID=A0A248LK57_9NEIS|nr:hypothetical protein LHGZ1_2211 [Laribacter hongkongensis]
MLTICFKHDSILSSLSDGRGANPRTAHAPRTACGTARQTHSIVSTCPCEANQATAWYIGQAAIRPCAACQSAPCCLE